MSSSELSKVYLGFEPFHNILHISDYSDPTYFAHLDGCKAALKRLLKSQNR